VRAEAAKERGWVVQSSLLSDHSLWWAAAEVDPTLRATPALRRALERRRVPLARYSRARLFRRLAAREPSHWWGMPVRYRDGGRPAADVLQVIRAGFAPGTRVRVRAHGSIRGWPIERVAECWAAGVGGFNVPDLHYVGSRFDRRLDTSALNAFNLLQRGTDAFESQDSLVISPAGAMADSHSDDHSGSNHCFVGAKLWLMWDTVEGLARGLEDVERCDVTDRAAFDLETFAALPSARWLVITGGQTIFVPGHLSHKVVTLERYLGLGSFFVALPGYAEALARWIALSPVWSDQRDRSRRRSVAYVHGQVLRRVRALRRASRGDQNRWGLPLLRARLRGSSDADLGLPDRDGHMTALRATLG
jgi:hypothetical protein